MAQSNSSNAPDFTGPGSQSGTIAPTPEMLLAMVGSEAEQTRQLAQQRSNDAHISIGVDPLMPPNPGKGTDSPGAALDPTGYILPRSWKSVTTFGRTTIKTNSKGQDVVFTPNAPSAPVPNVPINSLQIARDTIAGVKSFDLDKAFKDLREAKVEDRITMAESLLMHIEDQVSVEQQNIRQAAAQRSGSLDAEHALQQNMAADRAALQLGKIKFGDTTHQTQSARKTLAEATAIANAMEIDAAQSNPTLRKLNTYKTILNMELKRSASLEAKSEALAIRSPVLTDTRIENARLALGLPEGTSAVLTPKIQGSLIKDKALTAVLDADKYSMPAMLVDSEPLVRRYAYNILKGTEMKAGLDKDPTFTEARLPQEILNMGKIVADRTAILNTPALRTAYETALRSAPSGAKEKEAVALTFLVNAVNKHFESQFQAKYDNMSTWQFINPEMKAIVQGLAKNDPKGVVMKQDAISAIVSAPMKNSDGTEMSIQQKLDMVLNSLDVTLKNDPGSYLSPIPDTYKPVISTAVKDMLYSAYVRSLGISKGLTPLGLGSLVPDSMIPYSELGEGINKIKEFVRPTGSNK